MAIFAQGKGEGMKEEWIAYVLKQTLQGLKYFHDQGQVRASFALVAATLRTCCCKRCLPGSIISTFFPLFFA